MFWNAENTHLEYTEQFKKEFKKKKPREPKLRTNNFRYKCHMMFPYRQETVVYVSFCFIFLMAVISVK